MRTGIDRKICSRFCLCKKKLLERSLSLPCGVVRQREAVGNNEERVLSTVSRSACVFFAGRLSTNPQGDLKA